MIKHFASLIITNQSLKLENNKDVLRAIEAIFPKFLNKQTLEKYTNSIDIAKNMLKLYSKRLRH